MIWYIAFNIINSKIQYLNRKTLLNLAIDFQTGDQLIGFNILPNFKLRVIVTNSVACTKHNLILEGAELGIKMQNDHILFWSYFISWVVLHYMTFRKSKYMFILLFMNKNGTRPIVNIFVGKTNAIVRLIGAYSSF